MTKRLESVGKVVDTGAPRSMGGIGYDRRKKQQLVVARQRTIDFENKKLVDSMAAIMRGEGPPLHPYRPYIKGSSKTAVERKMIRQRIDLENQFIADRLRNRIEPVINHLDHARDYAKNTRIRKNISTSCKREVRTKQFQAAKSRKAAMSQYRSSSASLSPERRQQYEAFDQSQMSTSMSSLHTANEVRRFLAEERGIVIPEGILSSRTTAPKQSRKDRPTFTLQFHHRGADPRPHLQVEQHLELGTEAALTGQAGTPLQGAPASNNSGPLPAETEDEALTMARDAQTLGGLNESSIEIAEAVSSSDSRRFLPEIHSPPSVAHP